MYLQPMFQSDNTVPEAMIQYQTPVLPDTIIQNEYTLPSQVVLPGAMIQNENCLSPELKIPNENAMPHEAMIQNVYHVETQRQNRHNSRVSLKQVNHNIVFSPVNKQDWLVNGIASIIEKIGTP